MAVEKRRAKRPRAKKRVVAAGEGRQDAAPPQPYALVPAAEDEAEDRAAVAFAADKARQLLDHLRAKHGADQRAQRLVVSAPRVVMMPPYAALQAADGAWLYGKFWFWSSALEISPRERTGALRARPGLLVTLVHEMAHAATSFSPVLPHGAEWKEAVAWLTDIASKELRWDLPVPCRYCGKYGLCAGFCKPCRREAPCANKASLPVAGETPLAAFAAYPTESRQRVCAAKWPYPWVAAMCKAGPATPA